MFQSETRFDPTHPKALAIYCSDGRFTHAVEELFRSLGHARLDTMTMPGGPALLNLHAALYSDADSTSRAASFLIRGHAIEHVILLAHESCGYYRARYPTESPSQLQARQVSDLAAAAHTLRRAHPGLRVDSYYAHAKQGRISFHPA